MAKVMAENRQLNPNNANEQISTPVSKSVPETLDTRKELAKTVGVGEVTMGRPKENLQKFLSEKQAYREVWDALRNISISDMEVEGRIYGGGLKKIEPKELAKVKCNNLQSVLK